MLWDEIESHAAAEEQTLYAELLRLSGDQELVRHNVLEHDTVVEAIAELGELDVASPGWTQKFVRLKQDLDRHIEAEETHLVPLAHSLFSANRAVVLGEKFARIKRAEIAAWGRSPISRRLTPA